jgi:ribose 5-phosphate isomerase B
MPPPPLGRAGWGTILGVGMKIAVGSDERTHVTDAVVDHLRRVGVDVELHGPLNNRPLDWVDVGREVGERVASGACQQGVLFCWTGTGVSIAANKVAGIRAALCNDAETAKGARKWNDANVLAMSLRSTPEAVAKEIVDAWLETGPDEAERETIAKVEHREN